MSTEASMLDAREALLRAGRALAATRPQPSRAEITAEAGLGDADFERAFGSLDNYLETQQRWFVERVRQRVLAASLDQAVGRPRIDAVSHAYLDTCLELRPLRQWLQTARRERDAIAAEFNRPVQSYLLLLRAEFEIVGWPFPAAAARLYMAMLFTTAHAEQRSARANGELRAELGEFLSMLQGE